MNVKKPLLIVLVLGILVLAGCSTGNTLPQKSVMETESNAFQSNPLGGIPTPFEETSLGDYGNNYYQRELEVVDYNSISPKEYRIRSAIEFVGINNYRVVKAGQDPDAILKVDVSKYGIDNYCSYGDLVMFRTYDDMIAVINNKDFQTDLRENYGFGYTPIAYYLPKFLGEDYSERSFVPLDDKYHFIIYGYEYTEDKNYYKDVWAVFDVQDSPSAEEIAQFYADLDDLQLKRDEGPTDTVYHFTSENGSAFFEKFGIETNDPATAYIWAQDGVLGVIILPGEHKPENLDLCVLEKHEL